MRTLLLILVMAGTVRAGTVTLEGQAGGSGGGQPPLAITFRLFTVDDAHLKVITQAVTPAMMPSSEPQVWALEGDGLGLDWGEAVAAAKPGLDTRVYFGLGSAVVPNLLLDEERVKRFELERLELELTRLTVAGAWEARWRMQGEGVVVPEPGWLAMVIAIMLTGRRYGFTAN